MFSKKKISIFNYIQASEGDSQKILVLGLGSIAGLVIIIVIIVYVYKKNKVSSCK